MRGGRSIRAALVVALAVTASMPAASAHDHRPPRTMLRFAGQALQRGSMGTATWVSDADENYVVVMHADGSWEFPEAVSVVADRTAAIRIRKPVEPRAVSLEAWVTGDHHRYALGPMAIDYDLVRAGASAWDLRFDTGLPCRHYYVTLSAEWLDEQGSRYSQDATWLFHYVTDVATNGQRVSCTS